MNPSRIIGAGLSGLIAAHAWPNVPVVEAAPEMKPHRALLRFRSDMVSHLVGIPFRRVLVRKGLWYRGGYCAPTIALANAYSSKVLRRIIGDRSVWNLDPVERYIAPDNFQEQLLDNILSRVTFNHYDNFLAGGAGPIISTAPMYLALRAMNIRTAAPFDRAAINVERFRISDCDAHQTVYFPDPEIGLYRASITGGIMIAESIVDHGLDDRWHNQIEEAFGVMLLSNERLESVKQEHGKIVGLPDDVRKGLMFRLTHEHRIYSLGRFAQWRNILLDDVVGDIGVIKKLLRSDSYELSKARMA